jgi:ParB family chromosome partitioning protein
MASIRDKLAQKKSKLSQPKQTNSDHPANTGYVEDGAFFNVETDLIIPNPKQPRKYFDEVALQELSDSIKQTGVIQPIVIQKNEDKIVLVAGERRLRAAKMAGLPKIPCILTKGNPIEIALIENLQRENLNPIEESDALNQMIEEYQYTQQDLAHVIGKGRSTITETLSLKRLPSTIKDDCRRADSVSRRVLVEVAKQESHTEMLNLYSQIKKKNLTSDDVRKITRKKKNSQPKSDAFVLVSKKAAAFVKQVDMALSAVENEAMRTSLIQTLKDVKSVVDSSLENLQQQGKK